MSELVCVVAQSNPALMFGTLCSQAVGRQAGLAGLGNLGNSCFMNAAVQCLAHTAPLKSIFLNDAYKVQVNRENANGSKGAVVSAFADVMQALWQVIVLVIALQRHAVFVVCIRHRRSLLLPNST